MRVRVSHDRQWPLAVLFALISTGLIYAMASIIGSTWNPINWPWWDKLLALVMIAGAQINMDDDEKGKTDA